jgi:hypothetical protein
MDETVILWVLGILAGLWLLNRLLASWVISKAAKIAYQAQLQKVLYGKEHQVKGRFE